MEYIPSWQDDLYLAHHGVKGQKWGVRRYQNEDGSRTAAGRARLGTAARTRQKQQKFKNKIKETGDGSLLDRNFINDYRRGRIAQLETKARHREAIDAYRKDKSRENAAQLRQATAERLVKNGLFPMHVVDRGTYNRYRQEGKTITDSVLMTAGKHLVIRYGSRAGVEAVKATANAIL